MDQKILGTSTLYGHGKTNIPATIRKKLGNLKDGERLVYYEDSSGKITISNDKVEQPVPTIYYPDMHH